MDDQIPGHGSGVITSQVTFTETLVLHMETIISHYLITFRTTCSSAKLVANLLRISPISHAMLKSMKVLGSNTFVQIARKHSLVTDVSKPMKIITH